jgi:hypothetical protein
MIIPIHGLKDYQFEQPLIGDEIQLVKDGENLYDPMAIAAYNKLKQKIGNVSIRNFYNQQVYNLMLEESINALVWSVGKNQILVEIEQFRK